MEVLNGNSVSFLHQNIRLLRKRLELSQEELAAKIGLNRGNIASYENGTAEPKICNLLKMAHLFSVSLSDFMQKDLSREEEYEDAIATAHSEQEEIMDTLLQFSKKMEELHHVIESLYTCHQFKVKTNGDLSKDAQVIMAHFDQMHEAAQHLLENFQELLDFAKCRVK